MSGQHSVSVAAAVVNAEGRVLVIRRRDNGQWEPPGGVLELGEGIEAGLHREVREETGLDIDVDCLTGVYKNQRRGIVALVFRARVAGGSLAVNDEVRDFRWLAPEEVPGVVREVYAVRLLDAVKPASCVAVREHDGEHLLPSVAARSTC